MMIPTQVAKLRFANGYGASIITGPGAYGSPEAPYELAVLDENGALDYSTPLGDDVIGHLAAAELLSRLQQISDLPPKA